VRGYGAGVADAGVAQQQGDPLLEKVCLIPQERSVERSVGPVIGVIGTAVTQFFVTSYARHDQQVLGANLNRPRRRIFDVATGRGKGGEAVSMVP
jgi:hypothetical protein